MEKEIEVIIKEHYNDLKKQLEIEKVTHETSVFYNNQKRIKYLEELILAYEKLLPNICSRGRPTRSGAVRVGHKKN